MQEQIDSISQSALKAGASAVESGELDLALEIYQKLLNTAPENGEAHNGLGVVWSVKGDLNNAVRYLKSAVKYAPDNGAFHRNLGAILVLQKRYKRAMREFEAALKLNPNDVDAAYQLATVLAEKRKFVEYEKQLKTVLEIQPDHFEANNDLGCYLITKESFNDAVSLLTVACDSPKAIGVTHANLANAFMLTKQTDKALIEFEKAVELDPKNPDCLMALATLERNLGNLEEAERHALAAIEFAPQSAPVRNLIGTILREQARHDEAAENFERALELDPGFAPAQVNRGLIRLLNGDWLNGFEDVEARWRDPNYPSLRTDLRCPLWDGSPLSGETVFLYTEQGYGDTIQNFRFAQTIVERGGKVVIDVKSELAGLFEGTDQSITVLSRSNTCPQIDLFAPLMSLPHILGIHDENDIVGDPYLTAGELPEKLAAFFTPNHVNVGVNWAGAPGHKEDYKRSIAPNVIEMLSGLDGVRFFNLHFGEHTDIPDLFHRNLELGEHVDSFSDSAAIINELDLVISVDTATVHLAGALGKTCWALIPFVPDWRWLMNREDSPWYQSVRLFRQPELGNWHSVIDTVKSELSLFVQELGVQILGEDNNN